MNPAAGRAEPVNEEAPFVSRLKAAFRGRVTVVGVGNRARQDDAAGSIVAEQLKATTDAYVVDAEDIPESFLGPIMAGRPDTMFLDAVEMAAAPGAVALLSKDDIKSYWPTTHRLPLDIAADFLSAETHANVLLIAIQPQSLGFGEGMSEPIKKTVDWLATTLGSVLSDRADRISLRKTVS
jgi:hydrogenase 3 maturation protease